MNAISANATEMAAITANSVHSWKVQRKVRDTNITPNPVRYSAATTTNATMGQRNSRRAETQPVANHGKRS